MKNILIGLVIFAIPKIAYAQAAQLCWDEPRSGAEREDFSMSGEARVKQFILSEEPDLMKNDYSDYDITPDNEVGLSGHFRFWEKLQLDAYPYFWYSGENKIARVGLYGEIRYDIWGD